MFSSCDIFLHCSSSTNLCYQFISCRNINSNGITIDDTSKKKSTVKLQVLGTQNKNQKPKLKVGIILPSKIFKQRDYNRVSLKTMA